MTQTKRSKNPPRPGQPILSCFMTDAQLRRIRLLAYGRGVSVSELVRSQLADVEARVVESDNNNEEEEEET